MSIADESFDPDSLDNLKPAVPQVSWNSPGLNSAGNQTIQVSRPNSALPYGGTAPGASSLLWRIICRDNTNGQTTPTVSVPINTTTWPIVVGDNRDFEISVHWALMLPNSNIYYGDPSTIATITVGDRTPPALRATNPFQIDNSIGATGNWQNLTTGATGIEPNSKIRIHWTDKDIHGKGVSWNRSVVKIGGVSVTPSVTNINIFPDPASPNYRGYADFIPPNQAYDKEYKIEVQLYDDAGNFM